MDNQQGQSSGANVATTISAGMKLPPFVKGRKRPSPFSSADMNLLIDALNSWLGCKVQITVATQNADGNYDASGQFIISNQNSILQLSLPPGQGSGTTSIIPMQVVSWTSTNEYLSAKFGTFTAPDTFTASGSAINVALPWELRDEDLSPPYDVNDVIFVVNTAAGMNGVYVSGSELQYMDLGIGRTIAQPGSQRYLLYGTFGDYWVGKDTNGKYWPIARPEELRCSLASITLEGVSTTYAYNGTGANLYLRRTATHGSDDPVIEGITPVPVLSTFYIYADTPEGGTGAVIQSGDSTLYGNSGAPISAGTAITLSDMNRGGRAWSVLPNQTGEGS